MGPARSASLTCAESRSASARPARALPWQPHTGRNLQSTHLSLTSPESTKASPTPQPMPERNQHWLRSLEFLWNSCSRVPLATPPPRVIFTLTDFPLDPTCSFYIGFLSRITDFGLLHGHAPFPWISARSTLDFSLGLRTLDSCTVTPTLQFHSFIHFIHTHSHTHTHTHTKSDIAPHII